MLLSTAMTLICLLLPATFLAMHVSLRLMGLRGLQLAILIQDPRLVLLTLLELLLPLWLFLRMRLVFWLLGRLQTLLTAFLAVTADLL